MQKLLIFRRSVCNITKHKQNAEIEKALKDPPLLKFTKQNTIIKYAFYISTETILIYLYLCNYQNQ